MDEQKALTTNHTDRMVSMFAAFKAIVNNDEKRVIQQVLGQRETEAMLSDVFTVFRKVISDLQCSNPGAEAL